MQLRGSTIAITQRRQLPKQTFPARLRGVLLIMKFMASFLLVAGLAAGADGFSQRVTLSEKNVTLEKVFGEIKSQTGYVFFFDEDLIKKASKINIEVRNIPLEDALKICLANQPLSYVIVEKAIVIKPKLFGDDNTEAVKPPPINVKGRIVNENGEGVVASIVEKGTQYGVTSDGEGNFEIKNVEENAVLVISGVSIESFEVKVNGRTDLALLSAKVKMTEGEDVQLMSTGYQQLPKERATGSFVMIDNKLLNRRVSTNILDRIDGIASGLLFNRNKVGNTPDISIRGRSTIFANTDPLIILDNFPYTGDINSINPNDVENITILKDAAAASIWGAMSGNGVIVITTKKGVLNQKPVVSFNSNLTVTQKPDLFYSPQLSSGEFIEVEQFLFDKGYYNSVINNGYGAISPAVAILLDKRNGLITDAQVKERLGQLANHDVRNDLDKYFYRNAIFQQHTINVRGGGKNQHYYISGGFDNNINNRVGNAYDRFTLNANNTYYLLNNRLQVSSGVLFSFSKTKANDFSYSPLYPYERPAGDKGEALAVVKDFRTRYIDTAGAGRLLDWAYYPMNERNANNIKENTDYRINLEVSYQVIKGLNASLRYQYGRGLTESTTTYEQESYYTRDIINRYSQINYQTGAVSRPVPLGDIRSIGNNSYHNHFVRGQLTYDKSFGLYHQVSAFLGMEVKDFKSMGSGYRLFGYNDATATDIPVDIFKEFPQYYNPLASTRIPDYSNQGRTVDRFRSYFFNVAYTFKNRYVVSGSARRDESNLFGVRTNQKGVPLWSAGAKWMINREQFYNINWLPVLQLRLTYGKNGNVDKSTSAYTTARIESFLNSFGSQHATVVNPPNPSLRWETISTLNMGLDFEILKRIVSGSIEYYVKDGKDLIGNGPIAPQTGISQFRGNIADLRTRGVDIVINTINLNKQVKWNSTFLFSISKDMVTDYKVKQNNNSSYVQANFLNPLEGKPYAAIFSYPWAGLDTLGNPQGYIAGKVTGNYSSILSMVNTDELVYNGSAIPTIFGGLRNTLSWKSFEFSFNITYKLGYYYRRPSIYYTTLFGGTFRQADYGNRWKQRGDENITNVPSMIYPANSSRDAFYSNSEILVEKGDHIRLQDLQVSYTFQGRTKAVFSNLRIYGYANNLGILWRANKSNIDPDAIGFPASRACSLGISASF